MKSTSDATQFAALTMMEVAKLLVSTAGVVMTIIIAVFAALYAQDGGVHLIQDYPWGFILPFCLMLASIFAGLLALGQMATNAQRHGVIDADASNTRYLLLAQQMLFLGAFVPAVIMMVMIAVSGPAAATGAAVYLYRDAGAPENRGDWSGVMAGSGGATLTIDTADRTEPAAHGTAVRIDATLPPLSWTGFAVLAAPGYWGEAPGPALDLSRAAALVFQARGAHGGERVRIKVAVAGDAPFGDSAPLPFDTGWLTLDRTWREYRLPVDGADLSRVITPFVLIVNQPQNPGGAVTVFLDDVRFEPRDGAQ